MELLSSQVCCSFVMEILREINPEYSLEGLMLKLKLQYFDLRMWTRQPIGKVPDAGKDWEQKDKRVSEDEMIGQHHENNEYELGQTPGDGEGQGDLACYSPWGCKKSWLNMTEQQQQFLTQGRMLHALQGHIRLEWTKSSCVRQVL